MNYNRYFLEANKNEIEELELSIVNGHSLSFTNYNGDLENFTASDSFSLYARGNYHGKAGYVNTQKIDKDTLSFVINKIKENAEVNNSADELIIFKGADKRQYHNKNVFSKALEMMPTEDKLALITKLYNYTKSLDSRLTDITITYDESVNNYQLMNSYNLNLKNKSNCFAIVMEVVAKNKDEVKTNYKVFLGQDITKFNLESFAKETVDGTVSQFNSIICDSKKYPAVLANNVASSLLSIFLSHLSADEVQKNTSKFKDKLLSSIASKKVTVMERPLDKGPFFRSFDDEGVPTANKILIKNGVLQTYLYNLATAKKDDTTSTGNGFRGTGKIFTSLTNAILKPSKRSEQDLFKKVKNGIYITNVQGLHSGMNGNSGNFSLQANGYLIEDGKLTKAVSLITIAGNLFELFNNVIDVASNLEILSNVNSPSIMIKKIAVSGM